MDNQSTYRITILKRTDKNDSNKAIYVISRLAQTGIPFRVERYVEGFLQKAFTQVCSLINKYHVGENVSIEVEDISDKISFEQFQGDVESWGFEKAMYMYESVYLDRCGS